MYGETSDSSTAKARGNKRKKTFTEETTESILEKISRQNTIIIKKIEELLSAQNSLENRMKMLEDSYTNQKFFDESFVDDVVKIIAKDLLNKSVYPSQDEMQEATEEYLSNNHEDYFSQFNKESWTITYERSYYKKLLKKHRSARGSLCSRVKAEIFKEFGLKPINVKASLMEIKEWKSQPKLKKSFLMLFKPSESGKTHMVQILEKLWPKSELKKVPEILISYAVGISEVLLNPENKNIQITEQIIKPKIMKNLRDIKKTINEIKDIEEVEEEIEEEIEEEVEEDKEESVEGKHDEEYEGEDEDEKESSNSAELEILRKKFKPTKRKGKEKALDN